MQQASDILIRATVQDQEDEHHGMSTRHGEEDGGSSRYSSRTRTWVAATCWRVLSALHSRGMIALHGYSTLKVLENVSEAQVDEKIISAIANLDIPLVMGNRLKKVSKST